MPSALGHFLQGALSQSGRAVPCARAKQRWLGFEPDLVGWPQSYLWPGPGDGWRLTPALQGPWAREAEVQEHPRPGLSAVQAPTAMQCPPCPPRRVTADGLPPMGQPPAVGAEPVLT